MDIEFKLKQIEEEARHEKAMREFHSTHLDAHDSSIAAIQVILERTEKNIDALTIDVSALAVSQKHTDKMLQDLIALLTRENTNGKH